MGENSFPTSRRRRRGTNHDLRLGIFAAVLVVGMTIILSFNLNGVSRVNVTVGQPATNDIFAPHSLTYTSELLTQQAREQAAANVQEVYTPLDLSIGRAQLAQANAIFAFIDTVRADSLATIEEKIGYLQSIEGLVIDESVALDLLNMSQADYEKAKGEILGIVDTLMRQEVREGQLDEFQRIARRQASLELTPSQSNVVSNLAWQFIVPTVFAVEEETAAAREEAAAAVEPVTRTVVKNQRIIRAGDIINETDVELLTQLGLLRQESNWQLLLSIFLISLLSTTLIVLYMGMFQDKLHDNNRYLAVLAGLILLFVIIAKGMTSTSGPWLFLYPIAALSMLVAAMFDIRFSVLITVIMAGIFGLIVPNSLELAMYAVAGGLMALLTLRDAQSVVAIFRAGLLAALGYVTIVLVFSLPLGLDVEVVLQRVAYGVGNGLLSSALALVGFYILGGLFGIITILQLQELSRLDHPLLQELLRRAPGTYHHSIMVANLAEQAAERVRANSALVRVGAFYHDIGKMNHPAFFTENQEGMNPHDRLDPYSSARIILSHVPDGLELAEQYHLPNRIQDFIAEHHGTRIVKGFYMKARAEAGDEADEVDIERFRYAGPRPRTRETGIVMLADAVDATSNAVRPNTPAAIEKLVNSLVDSDVMQGQLNDSGLTLGDIDQIRASFIDTLKGRFHVRVKYPGNEQLAAENAPEREAAALEEEQAKETAVSPVQPSAQSTAEPLLPQDVPR